MPAEFRSESRADSPELLAGRALINASSCSYADPCQRRKLGPSTADATEPTGPKQSRDRAARSALRPGVVRTSSCDRGGPSHACTSGRPPQGGRLARRRDRRGPISRWRCVVQAPAREIQAARAPAVSGARSRSYAAASRVRTAAPLRIRTLSSGDRVVTTAQRRAPTARGARMYAPAPSWGIHLAQ